MGGGGIRCQAIGERGVGWCQETKVAAPVSALGAKWDSSLWGGA